MPDCILIAGLLTRSLTCIISDTALQLMLGLGAGLAPVSGAFPVPCDPDLARCAVAAALACLAAVWLRPSPFWALNVTRPFVLARIRPDGSSRFCSTV